MADLTELFGGVIDMDELSEEERGLLAALPSHADCCCVFVMGDTLDLGGPRFNFFPRLRDLLF